jgi:hypothetical protein
LGAPSYKRQIQTGAAFVRNRNGNILHVIWPILTAAH